MIYQNVPIGLLERLHLYLLFLEVTFELFLQGLCFVSFVCQLSPQLRVALDLFVGYFFDLMDHFLLYSELLFVDSQFGLH